MTIKNMQGKLICKIRFKTNKLLISDLIIGILSARFFIESHNRTARYNIHTEDRQRRRI